MRRKKLLFFGVLVIKKFPISKQTINSCIDCVACCIFLNYNGARVIINILNVIYIYYFVGTSFITGRFIHEDNA